MVGLSDATRVAARFRVGPLVGRGGMGSVYRAVDEQTGAAVALKWMDVSLTDPRRFAREAALLAELDHPAIVRYVAHGEYAGGLFLAMEWLDGTSLGERLSSGALSLTSTLCLARRVTDALLYLDERGIVHRDLKPRNLILVDGDVRSATLVDFGTATDAGRHTTLSDLATVIGTIGYMAPEHARGLGPLDGRADLFSLGCVLYECLAGVPPFMGNSLVAVLAKVLFDAAPSVRASRPDVPEELATLIRRLTAGSPDDRPAHAREVADVLRALDARPDLSSTPPGPLSLLPGAGELRMMTVMILETPRSTAPAAPDDHPMLAVTAVLSEMAEVHGGECRSLSGDEVAIVGFSVGAGPTERAVRAARAAIWVRERLPRSRIALTTGHAVDRGGALSLAADAAAALLSAGVAQSSTALDELTARLIEARFCVERSGQAAYLLGEFPMEEVPAVRRTLLGRAVPCVGRRKELAFLEATFDEVADDHVARAVVLTGPTGIGKTRLGIELQVRLTDRAATCLVARAVPFEESAAGAVLRTLVVAAAGLVAADGPLLSWERLDRYVRRIRMPMPDLAAEILGELVGAPSPHPPSASLHAARSDPNVLRHWLGQLVPQWLRAASNERPLVLYVEDAQWADVASLTIVDKALRDARESAVLAVVFLRTESRSGTRPVFSSFPAHELPIAPITRRAARVLARAALPSLDPVRLAELIERADGNPFCLEELLRVVASDGTELPGTLLALAEESLERTDRESRRLIRVASVIGERFELGDVIHVLGDDRAQRVRSVLDILVDDELLERIESEEHGGQAAYRFRHGLLRDAAYAMLPEGDRAELHARMARRLEARGESEAGLLAEHWRRAGNPDRAALYLAQAAERALARGDASGAARLAQRGLDLEPGDARRGELLHQWSAALGFAGDFEAVKRMTRESIPLLPRGRRAWLEAVAGFAFAASMTSDFAGFGQAIGWLTESIGELEVCGPAAVALQTVAMAHLMGVGAKAATPYCDLLVDLDLRSGGQDAVIHGWVAMALGAVSEHTSEPAASLAYRKDAFASFTAAGDPVGMAFAASVVALLSAELGILSEGQRARAALQDLVCEGGLDYAGSYGELAAALLGLATTPQASYEGLRTLAEHGSLDVKAIATPYAATLALREGRHDDVRSLCAGLDGYTLVSARRAPSVFRGLLAIAEGDPEGARRHLEEADAAGGEDLLFSIGRARERLRIEVLEALGDARGAAASAASLFDRLRAVAEALPEEHGTLFWRDGFDIPETLRLIERVRGAALYPSPVQTPISTPPEAPAS